MLNGVATATSGGMAGGPIIDHIHANLTILNNTTASYSAAEQSKLAGIAIAATANSADSFLLSRTNHTGTQLASSISDFTSSVNGNALVAGAIQSTAKGAINGVATLDGTGTIPASQLPAIAITNTSVVANETAMLALTAQVGDVAIRTDLNKSFILKTTGASVLINWQEILTPTDNVLSVNGQTGAVSLSTTNISEGTSLYYTDARVSANATVAANAAHAAATGNPHNATTSNISEGANLYYTEARVSANTTVTANAVHAAATGNPHGATTSNINEGTNLYYTDARVTANTTVAANATHAAATGNPHGATTSNISEGSNLYYTDARVTSNVNVAANTLARHSHSNSAVLAAITAPYTLAEQTKLNGVATAATANSADAVLLSRSNHTGTQLSTTISDFNAAVDGRISFTASSQVQALAGTDNATHMTPLRTREAIVDSKHIVAMNFALA